MAMILVVDDDVDSRQLYVSLLTPFGHQVIEASDGKEGLEQALARTPDLIISDILMPTMNGYEFVTSLRNLPALDKIPVIFHTASFLDRETRTLGASCGVSLFIVKPCEPEHALTIIHQALGGAVAMPTPPLPGNQDEKAIPVLIDAFFKKGKELDTVSLRFSALLELGLQLARPCETQALLRKAELFFHLFSRGDVNNDAGNQ